MIAGAVIMAAAIAMSFLIPKPPRGDRDSVRYLSGVGARAAAPVDVSSPVHGPADGEAGTCQESAATLGGGTTNRGKVLGSRAEKEVKASP